ncbi:MAG: ABC transporter ATP-binding protein [Chloroflexota bacterium]|nr:ABC transporter ATP-binding protein [Chloroflexota bacterium]
MNAEFIARVPFKTDHRTPLRFILSHIARHPKFALMMVFGSFSNAALAASVPYFIGRAFNAVTEGDGMATVVPMAWAIIASQLLRGALQLMRNMSSEVFAQRVERDVRDELYASLLGKDMTFHDMQPVGEIMARVTNDVREMNLMMNPGLNLIIGSGMFLFTPIVAMLLTYPPLALMPTVFFIGYILSQITYLRELAPTAQRVRVSFGTMNAQVAESLDGLQVVKGAAQEVNEAARFNLRADEVRAAVTAQGRIEARYIAQLLLGIVTVGAFAHGAILYRAGLIDNGMLIALIGQVALFGFPVFTSQMSFSQAALGYASAKRILDIINTKTDLDQNVDGYAGTLRGAIRFENVDFGYQTSGSVLHDVSFDIQPGQTIAIVGQTGSGKSTITKLINRIYDADKGRILVDGIDVREWDLARLRGQVSVIEQDIFLFSRSIADNIRFGKPDATQAEIEAAAQAAQAHEFILSFPEGYATMVGQRGVTLSGGQRQRLALARAFIAEPPILILDDSTSAIDSATEDKIQQAIWAAAQGRTTLLITHRMSQIRWADHIIVLRQGRVVAQGTHDHLMASSDAYRRIFALYEGAPKARPTLQAPQPVLTVGD